MAVYGENNIKIIKSIKVTLIYLMLFIKTHSLHITLFIIWYVGIHRNILKYGFEFLNIKIQKFYLIYPKSWSRYKDLLELYQKNTD